MKTKNKSLYKHIGLATLGAVIMLCVALLPAKKVNAARPSGLPEGYYNDYSYFVEDGNIVEYDNVQYNTGVLYLDGAISREGGAGSGSTKVPGIVLPTNLKSWQISSIVAEPGTVLTDDCMSLFSDLNECTSIDLKNATLPNKSTVYMFYMFERCSKLESVDLSGLVAKGVWSTKRMFYECRNLKTINLSNASIEIVHDSSEMFSGCLELESLDLTGLNMSYNDDLHLMFSNCRQLKTLDLSSFDTSCNTDLYGLFEGCSSLTSITFGEKWNTSMVYDFDRIFYDCISLNTIYVKNNWVFDTSDERFSGVDTFTGATNLLGGAGTAYDANHTDYTYAKKDGGSSDPGYFTTPPSVLGELDASSDSFTLKIYIPIDLNNNIYITDYYFKFGNDVYDDKVLPQMEPEYVITRDGKKYFRLDMCCAAKEMTDTKNLTVKLKGNEIINEDLSIAKYLRQVLNTPAYSSYHAIAGNMLRYGAAAQIYFGYNYTGNAGDLANYGIGEEYSIASLSSKSIPSKTFSVEAINNALNTADTNYEYGGINIIFGKAPSSTNASDVGLMLAFKPKDGGSAEATDHSKLSNVLSVGKTAAISDSIELYKDNNDKYKIARIYVPIKYLGEPIYNVGGTELSIMQYLNLACNTDSGCTDNLKTLCKALYAYYEAVHAYSNN